MDEISALSISISIASLVIYCLFFASNDDDDQDGGKLIKSAQKINQIQVNNAIDKALYPIKPT